ncbi:IS5 family transposase [Leptolyngbya sp. PCC 6406]|uniref:IS5 family transposase n=2 Tax=Leptolyngbya sp. PCC 6406 TaxID=1173264 RepID=UPI000480D650|nr:IS5 family transposase [Leptolyngbya sp. PCC 6406]
MRLSYPTDLTDEQWDILSLLIPPAKPGGRPRSTDMREVVNAILYVLDNSTKWRCLPHDFPKAKTVYHYFRQWRNDGVWEHINHRLRELVRLTEGREASPSAAVMDSQSVNSDVYISESVGFDANKKVKGRKRNVVVDTMGLVLMVVVTAASLPERDGARKVLEKMHQVSQWFTRLCVIWVDGGYSGNDFMKEIMDRFRWVIEVIKRPDCAQGFVLLPKRWVVERTFGWFTFCRRLSKDYERLPETAEAWIYVANIRVMLRRLTC